LTGCDGASIKVGFIYSATALSSEIRQSVAGAIGPAYSTVSTHWRVSARLRLDAGRVEGLRQGRIQPHCADARERPPPAAKGDAPHGNPVCK